MYPSTEETGLGAIAHGPTVKAIQKATNSKKRSAYNKFTAFERFKIGKYASENGPTNAVRTFQKDFLSQIERKHTAREFRKKYEAMLKNSTDKSPQKVLELEKRGRSLLLVNVDEKVSSYLFIVVITLCVMVWF